jgi:hypothetical protein
MRILITGIGNIGKSTLRERAAGCFPGKVDQVDMDYYGSKDMPESNGKVLLVEDVHGLERNPEQYDKIIYLMPPRNHTALWLKRAWAWFSNGIVDLSEPKGVNKRYALFNIPIILKIVLKNIIFRKRWILNDMRIIKRKLEDKAVIVESVGTGLEEIEKAFFKGKMECRL